MDKRIVKVLMGIPDEGHTLCESYDNRLAMAIHMGTIQVCSKLGLKEYEGMKIDLPDDVEVQFSLGIVGQIFPALARETIAKYAVEGGFDYLFMIDDDMLAPVDLFERLYKHQKDIVAALAFTRNAPHKPVIYKLSKGFDSVSGKRYFVNYVMLDYPKDTLVECDAVGFGAVLIKVDVLRNMPKPWFMTTSGAGEDIHFCHQAGEYNYKIYMDTATKLGHLGYPKVVTEEVYEQESNREELKKIYGHC